MSELVFVPYANAKGDYDGYTKKMGDAFASFGKNENPMFSM